MQFTSIRTESVFISMTKLEYYKTYIGELVNNFKEERGIDFKVTWKVTKDKNKMPKFFSVTMEKDGNFVSSSTNVSNLFTEDFQFYVAPKIYAELSSCYRILKERFL